MDQMEATDFCEFFLAINSIIVNIWYSKVLIKTLVSVMKPRMDRNARNTVKLLDPRAKKSSCL